MIDRNGCAAHIKGLGAECWRSLPDVYHDIFQRNKSQVASRAGCVKYRLWFQWIKHGINKRRINPVVAHSTKTGYRYTMIIGQVTGLYRLVCRMESGSGIPERFQ